MRGEFLDFFKAIPLVFVQTLIIMILATVVGGIVFGGILFGMSLLQ